MPLTVKTGAMKVKDPSSGNYVDVDMSLGVDYAPINSPEFTGTPKAPTAASETNNAQIATTAFVQGLISTEASARQTADSALQGSINDINDDLDAISNTLNVTQLSDLSGRGSHFLSFGVGVTVGGVAIPRYSKGVLSASSATDASLYAIDSQGNLYTAFRNGGTWMNGKNVTALITAAQNLANYDASAIATNITSLVATETLYKGYIRYNRTDGRLYLIKNTINSGESIVGGSNAVSTNLANIVSDLTMFTYTIEFTGGAGWIHDDRIKGKSAAIMVQARYDNNSDSSIEQGVKNYILTPQGVSNGKAVVYIRNPDGTMPADMKMFINVLVCNTVL